MNKSIACVFPETLPDEGFLLPLVQVFGQVVHMQAVENAPPDRSTASAFIKWCRQQDRLHPFTPEPLGDQRERFLALVRDIRRRGDTYLSQLSMLTLADLSRRDNPEPPRAILADLLHGADIREREATGLMLWQSRLMLELGEAYDIEQAELNDALHAIARRQESLFAELCEEEENPFVLPAAGQDDSPEADTILRHRLKAWTRLCFHGDRPAPGLLVTRHRTAMDLLQEVYERRWRQSARLLASLELPVPAAGQAGGAEEPPPGGECPALDRLLTEISASGSRLRLTDAHDRLLRTGLEEWSRATAGPAASLRTEPAILDLFLFPGENPARLWSETFVGAVAGPPTEREENAGCVAGLLRRR
ncbi:hypothetical protein [Desulfobulbus elongatus]|uniref:hypothetical protein n=1 Tax=Desulfobulbus elongatus TaxID=53332 RepID=UPI0004810A4C|nr:hypothetical protein [Desulfobulbus elongatus]